MFSEEIPNKEGSLGQDAQTFSQNFKFLQMAPWQITDRAAKMPQPKTDAH